MDTTTKALKAIIQNQIISSQSFYERKELLKLYNSIEESHKSESFFHMFVPHLPVLGMMFLGIIVALVMLGNLV